MSGALDKEAVQRLIDDDDDEASEEANADSRYDLLEEEEKVPEDYHEILRQNYCNL